MGGRLSSSQPGAVALPLFLWHRLPSLAHYVPRVTLCRAVLCPMLCRAARGGEVRMKAGIKNIELNEDGSVK